MALCRLLGDWVAKSSPRPYLRACEASRLVDSLQAVVPVDGTRSCASSMTSRPPSGRSPAGFRLTHENSAIWSWLTKPCHCSRLAMPTMLITQIRARLPGGGVSSSPGRPARPRRRTAGRSRGRPAAGRPARPRCTSPLVCSVTCSGRPTSRSMNRPEVAARAAAEAPHRLGQHRLLLGRLRALARCTTTRGASASTAASTAALNSSTSSITAPKSGSGWKVSGRPPSRRGVQTTTSVPAR